MQNIHTQNKQNVDNCFNQLTALGIVTKSKMWKFYRNVSKAWVLLDQEFVECRRVRRITPKYHDLQQNLNECIKVFEQWCVMAALMY